jgi:hypothetical protein
MSSQAGDRIARVDHDVLSALTPRTIWKVKVHPRRPPSPAKSAAPRRERAIERIHPRRISLPTAPG